MTLEDLYPKLFIGGEWVTPASTRRHTVISPLTEEPIAEVALASNEDMDAAVAAARAAFDEGPWPRMPIEERIAVMERWLELITARKDEFANLITSEMGMPITVATGGQAGIGLMLLQDAIRIAREFTWMETRIAPIGNAIVSREPVGVVASVVPWNGPLSVALLKLPPALLAGCTVVYKTSPESTLDGYLLIDLLKQAGLPDGVLNLVPAAREESAYLVTHPGVDKVSFTGSTVAGATIGSEIAKDFKRLTLELGGKSAAIVLDDADVDQFVAATKGLSFGYSGQRCTNKTRLIVPRSRAEEITAKLAEMISALKVGDPFDPATEVGPMTTSQHRDRVEGYIQAGIDEGARLVVGGLGRPEGLDKGWFVKPTLFADATNDMRICQEEIFGPVVAVIAYDTVEEAIAIANDSKYGLSGSVFSADPKRAFDVARRIRTGTVEINGCTPGFHVPLGGFKSSGIGREAGPEGFSAFTELKTYGLPDGVAETLV
ncbi:aldehyde dehydrogenase [Microbacterium sp. No. 7]|uniref:aldehyde dehydrogenase n=1 Tax=Microbacterium sp. No. 7 TaxID=1714373 RepID=UPI0006D08F5E|nr:aldehyde dehydrogenase [Microbacterium sp. No. 7]ALJ19301.1 aldehyde dehydrogenase [Microbacterium sp. No. 7]